VFLRFEFLKYDLYLREKARKSDEYLRTFPTQAAPTCLARPRRGGRDLARPRLSGVRGLLTEEGVLPRAVAVGTEVEIASPGIIVVAAENEIEILAVGKGEVGDVEAEGVGMVAEEVGRPGLPGALPMTLRTRSSAPRRLTTPTFVA